MSKESFNEYLKIRSHLNFILFNDAVRSSDNSFSSTSLKNELFELSKDINEIDLPSDISLTERKKLFFEIKNSPNEKESSITKKLWSNFLIKNSTEYEKNISSLFHFYRESGYTYQNLMNKCGNNFDYSMTNEIMDFFSRFSSSNKSEYVNQTINLSHVNEIIDSLKKPNSLTFYIGNSNITMKIKHDDIRIGILPNIQNKIKTTSSILHEYGHGILESSINSKYVDILPSLSMHESFAYLHQFYLNSTNLIDLKEHRIPIKSEKRIFNSPHYYNNHIAVRFEFEKQMLQNPLNKPQQLLSKISESILGHDTSIFQDPHWAQGSVGYFPAYSVGHVIAAHLFENVSDPQKIINSSNELKRVSELDYIEIISGKKLSTNSFENIWK